MKQQRAFAQIAAEVERGELNFPTSVNSALALQLALDDPDCHIEQAIGLTLAEPLLAARTVALANSVAFARGARGEITSVRAAVMRLGYFNLRTMASALVVRQFGGKIVDPSLRAKAAQLWEHTAHVAALARVIARDVTGANVDTALFAGIMHELGAFYLLARSEHTPGLLDALGAQASSEGVRIVAHAVMARLAVPSAVVGAIDALHDGMLSIPPETLADTLLLADYLVPVASPLRAATSGHTQHADSVIDFVMDDNTLARALAQSAAEVRSMSAALLV